MMKRSLEYIWMVNWRILKFVEWMTSLKRHTFFAASSRIEEIEHTGLYDEPQIMTAVLCVTHYPWNIVKLNIADRRLTNWIIWGTNSSWREVSVGLRLEIVICWELNSWVIESITDYCNIILCDFKTKLHVVALSQLPCFPVCKLVANTSSQIWSENSWIKETIFFLHEVISDPINSSQWYHALFRSDNAGTKLFMGTNARLFSNFVKHKNKMKHTKRWLKCNISQQLWRLSLSHIKISRSCHSLSKLQRTRVFAGFTFWFRQPSSEGKSSEYLNTRLLVRDE